MSFQIQFIFTNTCSHIVYTISCREDANLSHQSFKVWFYFPHNYAIQRDFWKVLTKRKKKAKKVVFVQIEFMSKKSCICYVFYPLRSLLSVIIRLGMLLKVHNYRQAIQFWLNKLSYAILNWNHIYSWPIRCLALRAPEF